MTNTSVRPILYLPNLADYRDRANLFGHVIRRAGGVGALVTSRLDVDPDELEKIEASIAKKVLPMTGPEKITQEKMLLTDLGI